MTSKIMAAVFVSLACAFPCLAQESAKTTQPEAKQGGEKQMQGMMGQPSAGQMT